MTHRKKSKNSKLLTTGQDKFGAFEVFRNPVDEPELCISGMYRSGSDHTPAIMLCYLDTFPNLPNGITPEQTILRQADGAIGIDCGCYAKLHRQVAHIVDKQQQAERRMHNA